MGTELQSLAHRPVVLPTADWLHQMREYSRSLKIAGVDLKSVLVSTVILTSRFLNQALTPSKAEYHQLLIEYLMELDRKGVNQMMSLIPDMAAEYAEVSTFFYTELIGLFKDWHLTNYQIRSLLVDEWVGDDLIVGIIY